MAKYVIERRLGAGGMGQVYLARQFPLGRTVALKVMTAGPEDANLHRRFEVEMRVLAALSHPNIVQIFDYGTDDNGRRYFAMEHVDGESLGSLIESDPDWVRTRSDDLVLQLLEAVACLHERGIIHRDLKPDNVMVDRDGRLKLVDFGLARSERPDATALTAPGTVLGTITFLAPELITGASYTTASDIWAVGCIYYQLLTGRLPFHRNSIRETLWAIVNDEPPPVSNAPSQASERSTALMWRLLEKDVARRIPDGKTALRLAQHEERARSRAPTAPPPVGAPAMNARTPPGRSALRGPVLLAFLVGGLLSLAASRLVRREEPPPRSVLPAVVPTLAPAARSADLALEELERALFRFRAGSHLRQVCEPDSGPHEPGVGMRKARDARVARLAELVRSPLEKSGLVPALAAVPREVVEPGGATPRGAALYAALAEFDELRNVLAEQRIPVDLPEPRGWPRDLAPVPEPGSATEVVSLVADRELRPFDAPGARHQVAFARDPDTLTFWVSPAHPRDGLKTLSQSRTSYVHPSPLPLRAARPGEWVILHLQVQHFGRGEQFAVRFRRAAGVSPWVVVNGNEDTARFHRVPCAWIRDHDSVELEYRFCQHLGYSGEAILAVLSVLYGDAERVR